MTCATLIYIFMTISTQLTTNTVIIFLSIVGGILLCPHKLRHMRPRSIGLIPSLSPHTELGLPNASERGTKSEVAHKWAGWLHNACRLGGPQRFRGGDKIRGGPQVVRVAT